MLIVLVFVYLASTKIKNLFDPDYSELDDAQEELTNYFNAVGNDRPSLV